MGPIVVLPQGRSGSHPARIEGEGDLRADVPQPRRRHANKDYELLVVAWTSRSSLLLRAVGSHPAGVGGLLGADRHHDAGRLRTLGGQAPRTRRRGRHHDDSYNDREVILKVAAGVVCCVGQPALDMCSGISLNRTSMWDAPRPEISTTALWEHPCRLRIQAVRVRAPVESSVAGRRPRDKTD